MVVFGSGKRSSIELPFVELSMNLCHFAGTLIKQSEQTQSFTVFILFWFTRWLIEWNTFFHSKTFLMWTSCDLENKKLFVNVASVVMKLQILHVKTICLATDVIENCSQQWLIQRQNRAFLQHQSRTFCATRKSTIFAIRN